MEHTVFEEITINKEKIRLEHRDVPLDLIELDEDNPRLRYLREKDGAKSLEDFIKKLPDAPKLRKDIEQNGGLREPVILKPNGKGKFKAAEGNRRVVSIGELHEKHPKDARWKIVPARILPKDVDPKKVAILRADQHVNGKVKWDAHEKAGEIYHMNRTLKIPLDEIVTVLHASKSTVQRFLSAYSMMMDTFRTIDKGKYAKLGDGKWSFFDELYRSKDLRKHLDTDPEFADNFSRWVGEERLAKGADVRKLAAILGHPEARKVFETTKNQPKGKPFNEAKKILESDEPEQGSDFFKLLAKVRDNCTSAAQVKEILRIRTDDIARKRVLETYEALVDFMRLADVAVPDAVPAKKRNAA